MAYSEVVGATLMLVGSVALGVLPSPRETSATSRHHGGSGVHRTSSTTMVGSVALALCRESTRPILVVKVRGGREGGRGRAAGWVVVCRACMHARTHAREGPTRTPTHVASSWAAARSARRERPCCRRAAECTRTAQRHAPEITRRQTGRQAGMHSLLWSRAVASQCSIPLALLGCPPPPPPPPPHPTPPTPLARCRRRRATPTCSRASLASRCSCARWCRWSTTAGPPSGEEEEGAEKAEGRACTRAHPPTHPPTHPPVWRTRSTSCREAHRYCTRHADPPLPCPPPTPPSPHPHTQVCGRPAAGPLPWRPPGAGQGQGL